jgi:hypothetical protein
MEPPKLAPFANNELSDKIFMSLLKDWSAACCKLVAMARNLLKGLTKSGLKRMRKRSLQQATIYSAKKENNGSPDKERP